jgi:hypothetical protein
MSIQGWYYLHTNGALIYKPDYDGVVADIRDSDFARGLWPIDPTDRAGAWRILVEAGASGADMKRIKELGDKWHCDDADAGKYAEYIGANLSMDGDQWCATRTDFENLQDHPAGFGPTCLEALIELAKEMDYQPSKMWGHTFMDLMNPPAAKSA